MKELTNTERLCATLLYYFTSGMEAQQVIASDPKAKSIGVEAPTDQNLEEIRHKTPIAVWEAVMPAAEDVVRRIVETEPRDAGVVAREALGAVRKIQKNVESFLGSRSVRPMSETTRRKS
jgi:hypothetical protein